MAKADRYGSKSEMDELDSLSEKLAGDLRRSIRQLENFPVLSDPWFEMADVFGRMATIADMEAKLSAGKNDTATLWETEEQALRYVLEDGKLNLCLRILTSFKKAQNEARVDGTGPMHKFTAECDKFEKGLGSIFRNAWQHIEVLQTTDHFEMLNHITDTLQTDLNMPDTMETLFAGGDIHQRQEILVFTYLYSLMKRVEDVGESKVMPTLRAKGIFMLAVRVLCRYGAQLQPAQQLIACQALSGIVETEHYITFPDTYVDMSPDSRDVELLIHLKETTLAAVSKDMANRKLVRPLNDAIDKIKRLHKVFESKK